MLGRWGSSQLNLGKVREDSTKFGDESTKVRDDSTKDRDESPKVRNELPKVKEESSQVGTCTSKPTNGMEGEEMLKVEPDSPTLFT